MALDQDIDPEDLGENPFDETTPVETGEIKIDKEGFEKVYDSKPGTFSPKEVIESLFKVETKTPVNGQRIVPFVLNEAQCILDAATRRSQMHYILKARQLGFSTYIEARYLAKCLTNEGTHAAVVSHERTSTARLLRRVHFFINNLPKGVVVEREYDNKYELTFTKTNSSFYLGTAGAKAFSRGDMVTDFHGSEVAFWPDATTLMTGVTGALTDDAECFLESTANGMGGYFYELYLEIMRMMEAGEDHPYLFHFFPWTMAKEYRRPVKPGTIWTPEELFMKQKYNLTFEQLAWRRWKKAQYKSEELFLQEFPIDPEEAFIVSGTCYFDKSGLRMYQRGVKDAPFKGVVEKIDDTVRTFRAEGGKLEIWEMPQLGTEYLITADCSEGIDSFGTDSTHIQGINREKFAQAFSMNGKIPPDEAADILYNLGKLYRWPWIAVEDNGPGLACVLRLKELGYPKIYRHIRYDLETQKETEKLGWHTDQRTRPMILGELRKVMKSHAYRIMDRKLLGECTTFCKQDSGKYEANSGCHDDRVIANAIAVYLHRVLPYQPWDNADEERDTGRSMFRHGYKTGY